MKWTTEAPKEMGYYWAMSSNGRKQIVLVDDRLHVFAFGSIKYTACSEFATHWSSVPISEIPQPWDV